MTFSASRKFFPKLNFAQFMSFYSVAGGMPAYMQQYAQFDNVLDACQTLAWDKQGLFYDEVNSMLKQELRTPNNYFAILRAVAFGKTRISKIANDSGLDPQLVNKYLKTLIRLQLVTREVPVIEAKPAKSKKGIYVLTENFVRFWFQYVFTFASDLEIGNLSQVKKHFKTYGHILATITYEQIARLHLQQLTKQLFPMDRVGRYWDAKMEIDGLGFNQEQKKIVFMEAKWSETKQDLRALNKLRAKAKLVPWQVGDRQEYFAIYSKAGFSDELLELNKTKKNLILVHQDVVVE